MSTSGSFFLFRIYYAELMFLYSLTMSLLNLAKFSELPNKMIRTELKNYEVIFNYQILIFYVILENELDLDHQDIWIIFYLSFSGI